MNISNLRYGLELDNDFIETNKISDIIFGENNPFVINLKGHLTLEWDACFL